MTTPASSPPKPAVEDEGASPVAQLVSFALLAVVGLVFAATSFGYGVLLEGGRVGPGLLPLVAGGLLAVLGTTQFVVLAGRLRRARAEADTGPGPEVRSGRPDAAAPVAAGDADSDRDLLGRTAKDRLRNLAVVAASIVVTIALVPLLGFLLAFGLLMLLISTVVERRRFLPSALTTLVSVAAIYVVFEILLRVPLPLGLFESLAGG